MFCDSTFCALTFCHSTFCHSTFCMGTLDGLVWSYPYQFYLLCWFSRVPHGFMWCYPHYWIVCYCLLWCYPYQLMVWHGAIPTNWLFSMVLSPFSDGLIRSCPSVLDGLVWSYPHQFHLVWWFSPVPDGFLWCYAHYLIVCCGVIPTNWLFGMLLSPLFDGLEWSYPN